MAMTAPATAAPVPVPHTSCAPFWTPSSAAAAASAPARTLSTTPAPAASTESAPAPPPTLLPATTNPKPTPVPLLLRVAEPSLGELEEQYLLEAWRSTCISGSFGSFISEFESGFARIAGCAHGVAVANGTVAIDILLRALGVQHGEEVLVPDWTYVSNAAATVSAGGTPVLVDCDAFGCIDPEAIRAAAVPGKTRFVWVVHPYGHPCDMDPIMDVANEFGLLVLEDAAEAHGALYKGRPVGSFGAAATFSFFANKIITTGEGGMVCTNDEALAARVRYLSRHAMSPTRRYFHTEVGFNYRMSNLLCAVGCAQVRRFRQIFSDREQVVAYYRARLDGECGIRVNPARSADVVLSPWLANVILPVALAPSRDRICAALRSEFQVDTRPFFVPMHRMPPYERCVTATRAGRGCAPEGSVRMWRAGFSMPSLATLRRDTCDRVVHAVRTLVQRYARAVS